MNLTDIKQQEIAKKLTNLSAKKRITLIKLLRKEGIDPLKLPITRTTRESNKLPLSWAQERLWFLNQLEGSSAAYNISVSLRITGNLDINALDRALSEIVRRHEVLRTKFSTINSIPIQVIDPEAIVKLNLLNLQQHSTKEQETVLQQLAQQEAATPFDLEIAPLIRGSLLQLSATEYAFLLTMHHIVSDAWSLGVFIQELSSLYQANCAGEPSPLPELPIQYADFAIWQRQWLSEEFLETQLNYWKQQLNGAPELLQLPTDRPRPTVKTYRGTTQSFTLNNDLSQKLQTLSRKSGTTLFMTLLAAFATLLYRYSGQSDILIGSPIANRHRSELESLIGFFVNTLVLRTSFEDNPSFEKLLAQVRETTLKAYEHQDVTFEQVVEALQPQRSLSHSPLFEVMFVLQNTPMGKIKLPGVTLSQLERKRTIAKFDLTLLMSETDQELVGAWEYNTDLFDGSTIERMGNHFQNLLSAIVENPAQNVNELPILGATERHQLLVEWNNTTVDYPQEKCIHQLFEVQVERTPDAVALVFEKQQLTYKQLNQRSNQLAHYLQSLGVASEALVGICIERSVEMVIGLLGILKAGGAYVPIDPNLPPERIELMLSDSQASIFLTQKHLAATLPENQARVLCIDNEEIFINQNVENPISDVNSQNLAYIIYTSGSTGKPKGVQITHSSVVNLLHSIAITPELRNTDTTIAVTTISFDVSVPEIYGPLALGGRVVVANHEETKDPAQLMELITRQNGTIMSATPATWRMLLDADWEGSQKLKIICTGEGLPRELADQLLGKCESLWNLYGPTEITVWATLYQVKAGEGLVAIGRPIANTQAYILDTNLEIVPIGQPGELHIGGVGLARGYLNRPELTAEKFIPNPFDKNFQLYKTGDLARYLPDGNIECIGRIDNQVKIRGFRIELGEIEAAIASYPEIQNVVVIAKEDNSGNKGLIAYFVSAQEEFSTQNLRQFLQEKLPNYAIPSNFVKLEFLPLTPNGKIDRKALPEPDNIRPELENNFVAPRTKTEELLVNIWSELLGVETVGIQDNFFELGGHSLLATQLIFKTRETFQIKIPLKILFDFPVIAQLASKIEEIVETGVDEQEEIDFNAETILDPTIIPNTTINQNLAEPQNILLTGVTGFVGAYLLDELLQKTSANIYCLIRANDTDLAKEKLKNKLESYLLWDEKFSSRIIPVVGDLSSKFLGLPTEKFNFLANQIDVIYHNGAWVNHIYPYTVLKPSNVLGTEEILRLASETHVKPVHFISTLGVLPLSSNSESTTILESDPLTETPNLKGGYIQSKWVAEKLVMAASDRGIPTCIYRLPMITADINTGASNINDRICRLIKGCIQLGMVPILEGKLVDNWVPVNDMSQAIIYLSQQENSLGKAFHLVNPTPTSFNNLFHWICSLDSSVKKVSLNDWVNELSNNPENALYPYLSKLEFQAEKSTEKQSDIPSQIIDTQNTNNGLKGSQIIPFTPIDEKYFETMLSYLTHSGFLNLSS